MKTPNIIATLPLLCLLAASSPFSIAAEIAEASEIRFTAGNAMAQSDPKAAVKSYEDESSKMHEAVAKRYEDEATALQAKIQEQRRLIVHYEDKSYMYGRQAQDLQAHAEALVRTYEAEVQVNLKEAALHRQMALKLKENNGKSS
ncbi:MAG: hypothetical protein M3Q16_00180 [Pseudomonadota bacterium]|nr:hypothetical protein [Pseudomonadota bacterium]